MLLDCTCEKHGLKYEQHPEASGIPVISKTDRVKSTSRCFKNSKVNVVILQGDSRSHLNQVAQIRLKLIMMTGFCF